MEAGDIRADNVNDFSLGVVPEILEPRIVFLKIAKAGDVIGQSIEPNIDHVLGVLHHRDPPGKGSSRNAKVLKTRFDEGVDHLVLAGFRSDESRVLFIEIKQERRVFGAAVEIGFFRGLFHGTVALGAKDVPFFIFFDLSLRPEGFFVDAIPAGIGRKVNIILF